MPKDELDTFQKAGGKRVLVVPYDYRVPKVRIVTAQARKLSGERIVVRIDNWPVNSAYPNGHFVRSLGAIATCEEHHMNSDEPYKTSNACRACGP